MSIRDLPIQERPRERLATKGASALSSAELIAILLGSGTQERSALELGSHLLQRFGSLECLADATLEELLTVKGIKLAKAVRLQAAFALWKRLQLPPIDRTIIDSPERAFSEIGPEIREEKAEVLCLLLRDARRAVLRKEIIARGILNQVLTHPREVFCAAIRHRAHSLIIAHNHPSGDPSPSQSDFQMTQILRTTGHVVGIPLADHLIVANHTFYSFRKNGLLDRDEFY